MFRVHVMFLSSVFFLIVPPGLANNLEPKKNQNPSTFKRDCHFLKSALAISNLHTRLFYQMQNDPFAGKQSTRLNEFEAPWAGNYFPMKKGGIARRWQTEKPPELFRLSQKFGRKKMREKILTMSPQEIAQLSPAEKMDILMNFYDFRITRFEYQNRGPDRDPKPAAWEGFCNGVRAAGICLPEPVEPITVKNSDGIQITFQPSDLKALAGASYFYVEEYAQLGVPTRSEVIKNEDPPNAGAFDIALRAHLGEGRKPFVIDIEPNEEIWNVSVVGYDRQIQEIIPVTSSSGYQKVPPETAFKMTVQTTIHYLGEIDIQKSNKATEKAVASGELTHPQIYEYELYLDKDKRIIDGRWVGRAPDMAWFTSGVGADSHYQYEGGNPHLNFYRLRGLIEKASRLP